MQKRARRSPAVPVRALAQVVSSLSVVLSRTIRDLTLAEARFALVGGLAVSARAEPRLTRDIDLAVAADDEG